MRHSLLLYIACLLTFFASCGSHELRVERQLAEEVEIFPDYKDVTIPANIAPLNFCMADSAKAVLIIEGSDDGGTRFQVKAKNGLFDIPQKKWRKLLSGHVGQSVKLTVVRWVDGGWTAFNPFYIHVAQEPIDPYLAYRLLQPYEQWNHMGIYQRNLETFEQTPIYENKLTEYNCVNCHTFNNGDPQQMIFHMRAKSPGTVLLSQGKLTKLNTKTAETISNLVYPFWHPSGRFIAASVNTTMQNYLYHNQDRVEVYDTESDVVIYDVERGELFSCEALKSDDAFESFPAFSPDGRSLYYTSTVRVDSVYLHPDKMMYSLLRIDFDPDSRTIGQKPDTIFSAIKEGRSVGHPRVSPDGKLLVVCLQEYGNFSVNNRDADLYAIDMSTGRMYPLDAANSDRADSWHSWSRNSRWMAFSSRRLDGYYTRPYFCYMDTDGQPRKPFLLPQKNPRKFYNDLMFSFNLPELVQGKVTLNQHQVATLMQQSPGTNLKYRE